MFPLFPNGVDLYSNAVFGGVGATIAFACKNTLKFEKSKSGPKVVAKFAVAPAEVS